MHRFLILALLCGLVINVQADEQESAPQPDYTIEFPKDWEVGTGWTDEDVYGLAPQDSRDDLFQENVNVLVDDDLGGLNLEEYYNLSLNGLKMLATDFHLIDSGETKVGDLDARYMLFTHRAGVYEFKVLQYIVVKGHKAYVITCTATVDEFPKYESAFKKIVQTFQLKSGDA